MTRHRRLVSAISAMAVITGTLLAGAAVTATVGASAVVREPRPAAAAASAALAVPAGTNLLVNPGAEVGDASKNGWSTVTIPGWQVGKGLPTVVHYGDNGFPQRKAPGPRKRGRQMFVGGAGGTARLTQRVPLHVPAGKPLPLRAPASPSRPGSAGLRPATPSSRSVLQPGRQGSLRCGGPRRSPKADRKGFRGLRREAVTARQSRPRRASATVSIRLDTSLTNDDGYNAPLVGYNHAVADDVRFTVTSRAAAPAPARAAGRTRPALRPRLPLLLREPGLPRDRRQHEAGAVLQQPDPARQPARRHVRRGAPQRRQLPRDRRWQHVRHPATDPLEENPRFTVDARNLGDLIVGAHETWKDYAQGMNGPCDDTVHGSYWNDDPGVHVLPRRADPAEVLRAAPRAAERDDHRPPEGVDHAQLRLGRAR